MGILNDLLGKVKSVESGLTTGETIGDVLLNYRDDIMDLQLYQLFSGKASNGEDIRPLYSEDLKPGGYFRSKETAKNYSIWKQEIPYPYQVNRNPDAPNLYINGKFHSELTVEIGANSVGVVPATSYAQRIVAKYGLSTFGLTPWNWNVVWRERGAFEDLLNTIKNKLYGN